MDYTREFGSPYLSNELRGRIIDSARRDQMCFPIKEDPDFSASNVPKKEWHP
jgi:hypothetical protein